jgi:hypothetical protein
MSDNNLSEIVGEDVNLASEAPETPEAPQEKVSDTPETPEAPTEGQQPDSRTVPLAALHEERARRKEMQAEMARDREERARRDQILEQRLNTLTQQREQAQMPSFEENPAEHLRHGQQQLQQTVQQIADANRAQDQHRQQMAIVQHLAGVVQQHEAAFVQATPDYQDAVTYLRNQRAAELMADGADEARAAQQAYQELVQLALSRAQNSQNPAEAAYKIATARGYRKAEAPQQQPSAAEKLQNQQRGVAASRSLGGGGASSNKLSLENLASMTDEEFAEATAGNKWAKLNGA